MCDSVASSSVTSEKPPGWTIEAWREFGDVINNALIADDTDFSDHQVTPANDMSCHKLAVLETMDIDANKTSVIEKSKIPNNILDNVCHDCFGKKEKTVSVLDNLDMSNNGPPTAKINEKFCGVENREQTKIKNDISLQEEVILEVMDVDGNINCTIENNCRIPVVVVSELLKLNIEEEYTVLGENRKAYSPVNILSETNIPGEVNHDSSTKNLHIVNGADYLVVSDNEKSGVRSNEGFHETENEDPNNITQNNDKKLTKKRRSNPQHWKQNERKVKRQRGEEYTNVKGANVPRRTVSEKMCHSNADCPFKCALKISQEERELIHSSFWKLNDEKKVHFYSKHIKRYVALRKRTKNEVSKKTFSYKYTFIVSGVCLQVCQEYFLNTLNISKQRVYYFFKNNVDSSTGIPRTPIQGKHPKKSISEERKNEVRDHIKSFPTVPSHYCRASTNKQYLERNLSMKRMYELYFQSTEDPVKFNIYEHIFKTEFNISFFKPKKDICDKCAEHEMLKNPTPVQTEVFEKHINRKNIGNKERNSDRTRHENDNTVGVLTFDLQNTFSLPKSNVSKNFYKMKLCCYNFTAHLNVSNKIYNAIWHEFLCGRAGIHIASAMIRILKAVIEDNPQLQKLILWSDSCVPQNKNSIMSFALQHLLKTKEAKNLEVIEQKFGEPGHGNVQEIDNAHSCIERYLRNLDIWSPLTLIRLLLKIPGTWKLKFRITQMLPKDYLDYQSFSARYTYNSVPYTKVKQLIYDKNEPLNIKYRESFEGKFITTKLRYARRINLKSELEFPDNVPQIALKQVVVPEQKKKHLLEMLPQMPEEERLFYSDLLGLKRVKKQ